MSKPIVEVTNISKHYRISHQTKAPYRSLRDEIMNTVRKPLELIRGQRAEVEEFWALKDVSFNLNHGDVVGIVGRNGSGKSTLLKILSRITDPTTGNAILRGKTASLLEVGTGFHPELTGRENIYFNGSILGMTRKEINRKFDDIVAFAETEKFLDTPVKFYSSGMYVRLAFAVAAHLDPDILIVDEVLAVGDAQFQKKCLGKMSTAAKEGRTVIFVSHSMETIQALCSQAILLENGSIKAHGAVTDIIKQYIGTDSGTGEFEDFRAERMGEHRVKIKKISLTNKSGDTTSSFSYGDQVNLRFDLETELKKIPGVRIDINIFNDSNSYIACFSNYTKQPDIDGLALSAQIEKLNLAPGSYTANVSLHQHYSDLQDLIAHAISFDVVPTPQVLPGINNIIYNDLKVQ